MTLLANTRPKTLYILDLLASKAALREVPRALASGGGTAFPI